MIRYGILLTCLVLASSCETTSTTSQPIKKDNRDITSGAPETIFELIAAAEKSSPARANTLRLKAAELALNAGNLEQTRNILDVIHLPLDPSLEKRYALLNAKIAIEDGNGPVALGWLKDRSITSTTLSEKESLQLGQLRAEAYYVGRSFFASARERIFLDPLLSGAEQAKNQDAIYSTLLELPRELLDQQAKKAITSELRGWLSLAAMSKRFQDRPDKQLEALNQWRTVWSNHPAAKNLPDSLEILASVVQNQATSIALFLPITGDLGSFGRAIRDGIVGSKFQLGRNVDINVYDTNQAPLRELLDRAMQDGAQLGIGPLARENVSELAGITPLPMPILALNRTPEQNPNLFQFGLAPEDEMIQVAEQVFNEGKRQALIIYPDTQWGERNLKAFQERWQSLGGRTIAQSAYSEQKDYSDIVKSLLNVDQSEERAANLRRITGQSFEFTPRRRQDIDFVFLLANQNQARGINPTLAFYYAEDIPVYSTSHVYEISDSKIESIDLNGIRFCDIPWKLDVDNQGLRSAMQQAWPQSRSTLAPFYALGVDAFSIYPRLEQLKRRNNDKFYGQTGMLRLNDQNIVTRTLAWAQFSNGNVIPTPQVVELATE